MLLANSLTGFLLNCCALFCVSTLVHAANAADAPKAAADLGRETPDLTGGAPSSLSAKLPQGMPARVIILYRNGSDVSQQRAISLSKMLRGHDIDVVDVRPSAVAIRTDLLFAYASDQAGAEQVGRIAGVQPVKTNPIKNGVMARPGAIELDISGS